MESSDSLSRGENDMAVVEEWKKNLSSMVDRHIPTNIFNADESGFFLLTTKEEICHWGERSKEIFTIHQY